MESVRAELQQQSRKRGHSELERVQSPNATAELGVEQDVGKGPNAARRRRRKKARISAQGGVCEDPKQPIAGGSGSHSPAENGPDGVVNHGQSHDDDHGEEDPPTSTGDQQKTNTASLEDSGSQMAPESTSDGPQAGSSLVIPQLRICGGPNMPVAVSSSLMHQTANVAVPETENSSARGRIDDQNAEKPAKARGLKRRKQSSPPVDGELDREAEGSAGANSSGEEQRQNQFSTASGANVEAAPQGSPQVSVLEKEVERLKRELAFKDEVVSMQRATIDHVSNQCTCSICLELAWRPFILSPCGHIFCVHCLLSWFKKPSPDEEGMPDYMSVQQRRNEEERRTMRRKKDCPQCRAKVDTPPVEVWLMKGLIERVSKSMVQGDADDADRSGADLAELKGQNLPAGQKVWEGVFDPRGPRRAIYDEEDGVNRCGECASEIWAGRCSNPNCGLQYSDAGSGDDRSQSEYEYPSDFEEQMYGYFGGGPIAANDAQDIRDVPVPPLPAWHHLANGEMGEDSEEDEEFGEARSGQATPQYDSAEEDWVERPPAYPYDDEDEEHQDDEVGSLEDFIDDDEEEEEEEVRVPGRRRRGHGSQNAPIEVDGSDLESSTGSSGIREIDNDDVPEDDDSDHGSYLGIPGEVARAWRARRARERDQYGDDDFVDGDDGFDAPDDQSAPSSPRYRRSGMMDEPDSDDEARYRSLSEQSHPTPYGSDVDGIDGLGSDDGHQYRPHSVYGRARSNSRRQDSLDPEDSDARAVRRLGSDETSAGLWSPPPQEARLAEERRRRAERRRALDRSSEETPNERFRRTSQVPFDDSYNMNDLSEPRVRARFGTDYEDELEEEERRRALERSSAESSQRSLRSFVQTGRDFRGCGAASDSDESDY